MRTRSGSACALCGGERISRDEVLDGGALCLAACERCGHLWTERPLLRAAAALDGSDCEVAEAA